MRYCKMFPSDNLDHDITGKTRKQRTTNTHPPCRKKMNRKMAEFLEFVM